MLSIDLDTPEQHLLINLSISSGPKHVDCTKYLSGSDDSHTSGVNLSEFSAPRMSNPDVP